jgi:hypothetical protein
VFVELALAIGKLAKEPMNNKIRHSNSEIHKAMDTLIKESIHWWHSGTNKSWKWATCKEKGNVRSSGAKHRLQHTHKSKGFTVTAVLTLAFLVGRTMQSTLYGVGTMDTRAFGAIVAVLLAAALQACFLPAWRASRVEPVVALRDE